MSVHNLRFPLVGDASPRTFTCSVRTRPSNSARYSRRFLFASNKQRHAAKPACCQLVSLSSLSMPSVKHGSDLQCARIVCGVGK